MTSCRGERLGATGGRAGGRNGGRREGGRTLRVYIYELVDAGRLPLMYTEQHLQDDALLSALLVVFISAASRPPILHPPPRVTTSHLLIVCQQPHSLFPFFATWFFIVSRGKGTLSISLINRCVIAVSPPFKLISIIFGGHCPLTVRPISFGCAQQ